MATLTRRDFAIEGIGSVELSVPDLRRGVAFYTGAWGLSEAGTQGGAVYLRGTGAEPYLVALREGPTAIDSVSWRAAAGTDLAALHDRLIGAGASPDKGIAATASWGGGTAFAVRDPAGRRLRVVQGARPSAPLPATGARPLRLAHVNINCADLDRDIAFHEAGLGFQLTDRSGMMGFLRTNADHHALVLARAPVDTLNHIAFLHGGWEDVMRASGRLCDAGHPIGWGPGRHGPGDNVFAYFVDPFGIVVEHTAEVLSVDAGYRIGGPDDWTWPPGRTDQWGIAPPKTDACKAAQLAIPFA